MGWKLAVHCIELQIDVAELTLPINHVIDELEYRHRGQPDSEIDPTPKFAGGPGRVHSFCATVS
jgi:hypothetical protein